MSGSCDVRKAPAAIAGFDLEGSQGMWAEARRVQEMHPPLEPPVRNSAAPCYLLTEAHFVVPTSRTVDNTLVELFF